MPKEIPSKPARKTRLKVYRTEAGFHDAYVAAPNMRTALQAWGARGDLFHQQAASVVTDPALTAEPLARPGQIILRRRDSHSALPLERKAAQPARSRKKPRAPPTRKRLDAAIAAIEAFDREAARELKQIDQQVAAFEKRRRALLQSQDKKRRILRQRRDGARSEYDAAFNSWRETEGA